MKTWSVHCERLRWGWVDGEYVGKVFGIILQFSGPCTLPTLILFLVVVVYIGVCQE